MNIFIVAEMSGNHNGSLQLVVDTIKAAKRAGADAIKLQTYTEDTLTLDCREPVFVKNRSMGRRIVLFPISKGLYSMGMALGYLRRG